MIAAEDVLTSEMGSIYGGKEPIKVVCKSDGIVELPTDKGKVTTLNVF